MTIILEKAMPLADVLNKLAETPEIETVSEKPLTEEVNSGLLKKAAAIPKLKNRPRKTIFVAFEKG